MRPQVDRLSKVRLIALCTVIGVFAAFLATGTTWGGGRAHTSTTGQCIVCHDTVLPSNLSVDLTAIHEVSWIVPIKTGCLICHSSARGGKTTLYSYLPRSFDCIKCHNLSGAPVDYHMDIDTKHTSAEEACMKCHSTGIFLGSLIASLTLLHQDLPQTVTCPTAVSTTTDDIYCYCLECHVNPAIIPTLPDNPNCTSCHEAVKYNATLNQCPHDGITSHTVCIDCHIKCP